MEVQRWLPWRSGGEESACQSRSSGTQASPLSGEIAHAATAGACTAEPASVTTRSCGPQPERSPCLPHQRRPASSSEGPAQPEAIIKAKQHRGVTRHATLKEQGWI